MADAQSDADKIRNKRLAKLGAQNSTPAGGQTPNSEASQSPITSPHSSATDLAALAPSTHTRPETPIKAPSAQTKSMPQQQKSEPSKITVRQTNTTAIDSRNSPHARPRSRQGVEEDPAAWESRTLCTVFRLTLDSGKEKDSHGNKLYYAQGLREDLEAENAPLTINTSNVEQAILAAATASGHPLDYLLACWKRVVKLLRTFRNPSESDSRYVVAKEAKRLCMSYCIFAATMPDMFDQPTPDRSPLADHLLCDPEDDRGICREFLTEAVTRFEEDDMVKEALIGAMETLSRDLSRMSMNDNFKPYVTALRSFCQHPPLVNALAQSDLFLPENLEPQDIEEHTLLGPFFRISPLQPAVAITYFGGAQPRDERSLRSNQNALRMTLRVHQNELFEVANTFVRLGKDSRERILDYFAMVVNKNHKRRATYVDDKTVSSDAFMINITTVLDKLCEPFIDTTFTKVDRIDVNYFRRSPRIAIEDETKINADQKTSDDFYAEGTDSGTNNFITEIFFLTVAAHHYGTEAANAKVQQMRREIKHLEQQIEHMKKERPKYQANPMQLRLFDTAMKKYEDNLERGRSVLHAINGVLLDDMSQQRSMLFMRYVIVWLIRLVVPGSDYPKTPISLPLPAEQPMVFRCLPEYLIEDIVDNFKFITQNIPQIIVATQCEELIAFCITFLRSSEYIKNPGLKAGLVSILHFGVWSFYGRSKGVLGDLLNSSPFALKHLLHALMKFYIEAESTGSSSAFYEKFNIRYEIFKVIQCIWSNQVYRNNLEKESKENSEFFVRFVNLMLNDVTYVLDESFSAFKKIHNYQLELKEPAVNSLSAEEKQTKEEAMQEEQRRAKNYMSLTNETIAMMKMFTEALADAFTTVEIVQRLADMMDYNLDSLVGKKQSEIKVDDPKQYGFAPAVLLSDLMSVYLNLSSKPAFATAIARDGRSYKPFNFANAAKIMSQTSLKSPQELSDWSRLAAAVQKAKTEEDEDEIDDIPDEFADPIMGTLMEDPVMLPTSKAIVDRSTIRQYLLSDPIDPFNRSPLKIEDVVPDDALRERVAAFKAEWKKKRATDRAAEGAVGVDAGGDTPMQD